MNGLLLVILVAAIEKDIMTLAAVAWRHTTGRQSAAAHDY